MFVWEGKGFSHVLVDYKGGECLNQPSVLRRSVHFPQNDPIFLSFLRDAFTTIDLVLDLAAKSNSVVWLASNLFDKVFVLLVERVGLVAINGSGNDVDDEVCIFKFLGVLRNNQMKRIDGFEADPLVLIVPNNLGHTATIEKQVVDDGHNLFLEVRLLAHLVVKPTLGSNSNRSQLLTHRNEAGKNVVANRAVDEGWLETLNRCVDQLNVQVRCCRPRLDLTAYTKVASLIE